MVQNFEEANWFVRNARAGIRLGFSAPRRRQPRSVGRRNSEAPLTAMTLRLAILYSAAAASALAAERRPVDLDGSRHLEAVGIPASPSSSFFDWYGASRFPTPSTALPSLPYEQLLETSRSASQDETGAVISKCMPVGNSSQNILGCLLDCQVCADLDSSTGKVVASNATCVEASGKRAFVTGGTNLTKTVYAAFAKMTESPRG